MVVATVLTPKGNEEVSGEFLASFPPGNADSADQKRAGIVDGFEAYRTLHAITIGHRLPLG
jgi:hypothetical protein